MQSIYQASDQIDAQRVVDLLASEGIAAHIQGGYLAGAMGDLPMQGLVSVWVADEDVVGALALIETEREAMAAASDDVEDLAVPVRSARSSWAVGFAGLAVGLVVGAGVTYWDLRQPGLTKQVDYDQDGMVDAYFDFEGEYLVRTRLDRNADGQVDDIYETPWESDSRSQADDDFDGVFETRTWFSRSLVHATEADLDGDGFVEWRWEYRHGLPRIGVLRDASSGAIIKRQEFTAGMLAREEFDADGDGTLETRRHFDTRGEILD